MSTRVGICEDDPTFVKLLSESVFIPENGFSTVFVFPSVIDLIKELPLDVEGLRAYLPDLLVIDVLPDPGVVRRFTPLDGISSAAHLQSAGFTFAVLVISSLKQTMLENLIEMSGLKRATTLAKTAGLTEDAIVRAAHGVLEAV